jgi:isoleucyl-tRNA synthetase
VRAKVTEAIEPYRRDKVVRSSLEAEVLFRTKDAELTRLLEAMDADDFAELLIVSSVEAKGFTAEDHPPITDIQVSRTTRHKCGRCWRHLPEVAEDGALCGRCDAILGEP